MATQRNAKGAARLNRLIDFNSYPLNVVLRILLKDRTTGENIIWATDNYAHLGNTYHSAATMRFKDLVKLDQSIIQPRVYKALELQKQRTKVNAEVFTPSWICCLMNNHLDDVWFDRKDVFNKMDGQKWRATSRKIGFQETGSKTWKGYVDSRRIEITCGEAPYLVSRYDTTTGKVLPISHRIGILDRKLRVVNENAETEAEWIKWALRAYQSTYGYEYQGDSLLIARINLLMTFCDYVQDRWDRDPTEDELKAVSHILSWNIWQMNGLTYRPSYDADADRERLQEIIDECDKTIKDYEFQIDPESFECDEFDERDYIEAMLEEESKIYSLDEVIDMIKNEDPTNLAIIYANAINIKISDEDTRDYYAEMALWRDNLEYAKKEMQILRSETLAKKLQIQDAPYCLIKNWRMRRTEYFRDIAQKSKGKGIMKFDFVIGNPPYQGDQQGESNTTLPVYHSFMDAAYSIGNKVLLITPARFLFNAGRTPKAWNEKMLNDEHFKVIEYVDDSKNVFSGVDIKGGVAVTYYNHSATYAPIGIFTKCNELNSILTKIKPTLSHGNIGDLIFVATKFNLTNLAEDYPQYKDRERRLSSNVMSFDCFTDSRINEDDIEICGVIKNKRVRRFINKKYIDDYLSNISGFKVILPKADGSGEFGEPVTNPEIAESNSGYTHTFYGIGNFNDLSQTAAALKYVKTKFARTLLSVLKVTQNVNAETWRMVPIQDFTANSDIDWSKTIAEIDQQLYAKYGLTKDEIDFIESKVKEMS